MARVPINHRILTCHCRETEYSVEPAINLSDDTVFKFLSEEYEVISPASSNMDENIEDDVDRGSDDESENKPGPDHDFWEIQHALLQSTLCRTSSLESRIRSITKGTIKEALAAGDVCCCGRAADRRCRKCLMEAVCHRLRNEGFNSAAICRSKWRSSPDMPSGEHTFLDVFDNTNPKKETRVIIELNFRAEFELARASEDYNRLIQQLPEIFVGKVERLMGLLKILCAAAKKCLKERKMHIGPWRRHRYMQAKWLRVRDRPAADAQPLYSGGYLGRQSRPRKSMLTVDLADGLPSLHRPAVAVV